MVGAGTTIPYFWAMSKDRDMTITPKLYANENVLLLNEYRQAFNNAFLIVDTGYTEGYKKNVVNTMQLAKIEICAVLFFTDSNVMMLSSKYIVLIIFK